LKKHCYLGMMMVLILVFAGMLTGCGGSSRSGGPVPTVYAATANGLAISRDGGMTFTIVGGLKDKVIMGLCACGSTIYAATQSDGLAVSTDGGSNFTYYNTSNSDLVSNATRGVYVSGSTLYVATAGGLSISPTGSLSFSNCLAGTSLNGVYVSGSKIYAATDGGLEISPTGSLSFTNFLSDASVKGVYVSGSKIYEATNKGLAISPMDSVAFDYSSLDAVPRGVYVYNFTIYAGTGNGLQISTNGGASFDTIKTKWGSDGILCVFGSGSSVCAGFCGTDGFGVAVSTDGGTTFKTYNFGSDDVVYSVFVQ
jgi:hypothetical protein